MAIGRDIIVPIINVQHPQAKALMENGINTAQLALLLQEDKTAVIENPEMTQLLENYTHQPIASWKAQIFSTDQHVFSQVENEPSTIGFCTFSALKKMRLLLGK